MRVCVALALAYALTATPRFTAEVDLLFDISRADLLRQQTTSRDSLTLNSMLESQVELLQSAGLARKTVERLGLEGDGRFVSARPGPLDLRPVQCWSACAGSLPCGRAPAMRWTSRRIN